MVTTPRSVWRNPIHFLAFGLGSGAVPKAPGTFGTLAGLLIYLCLPAMSPMSYVAFIAVMLLLGIWLCGKTADDIGVHDHGGIVWDEFVGIWLTLWLIPEGWLWLCLAFVLFRIFDIAKPWPIGWLDRKLGGGLGIMMDDVLAGAFAWICLQVLALFI
ncbi:phosphatidylglycerophosphatase A [Pseudohongiella nitratireducens]|uniref:Phosphatidylglycerophosphatase A n=1 Tax=Pseudohongiella nitratireducens TaxID=1768907 RepID=A0A917LR16_9GAMM|nr:phosphatidylglycerophosphatase A [Pseudohongiella nitratireducens]MDF1623562.1 phosphatidylglycerophosphatase A [Pseudohongiella nitratireducens]GGG52484.1 phosphatidylglycerophosphatase A [Pseudohongiella nitratireducens]|tara:strand:- start:3508 stop:3981 length:474 start_codon:yes stop_codon:yes gene_type:complete